MHRGMLNNWCPGAMETTWKWISRHCEAGTRHQEMFLPPPLGSAVNMDTTHHANYWARLLPKRSQMGQEHHICYCERTLAQTSCTIAAKPIFKQFALCTEPFPFEYGLVLDKRVSECTLSTTSQLTFLIVKDVWSLLFCVCTSLSTECIRHIDIKIKRTLCITICIIQLNLIFT